MVANERKPTQFPLSGWIRVSPVVHYETGNVGNEPMSTTEKVKHTPGPWTLTEHSGKYTPRHIIRSKNAAIIEFASFGSVGIEQREANARLIAAAPELLEALEQAHTLIGELL